MLAALGLLFDSKREDACLGELSIGAVTREVSSKYLLFEVEETYLIYV